MTRRLLLSCFWLAIFTSPAVGQEGDFLRLSPDPRANGMGVAEAALGNGPYAAWGNPAGLAFARGVQVAFSAEHPVPGFINFVEHDVHGFGSILVGLDRVGVPLVVNLSYNYFTYDVFDEGARYQDRERAFGGALAYRFLSVLSAGVEFKRYHHDRWWGDSEADGHAFDLGLLFSHDTTPIRVGVALNNIGPDVTVTTDFQGATYKEKFTLPETFRASVGTAFDPGPAARSPFVDETVPLVSVAASIGGEKQLSADIPDSVASRLPYLVRHQVALYGGVEIKTLDLFAVRLGYVNDEPNGIKDWTWGFGLSFLGYGGVDISNRPVCCDFASRHRVGGWVAIPFE